MSVAKTSNGLDLDDTFNSQDADLILRSSDGVDFAVHRCIIRLISPFFADMLSLPQSAQTTGAPAIIDMAEDAPSVRLLLMLSYPRTFCPAPKLDNVLDIKRAAAISQKFDSSSFVAVVDGALCRYAQEKPEVVYAISWRYRYKNALRVAARLTLDRLPFLGPSWDISEFEDIPATALAELHRYHTASLTALQVLRDPAIPIGWVTIQAINLGETKVTGVCSHDDTRLIFNAGLAEEGSQVLTHRTINAWWWTLVVDSVSSMKGCSHSAFNAAFDEALENMLNSGNFCSVCQSRVLFFAAMRNTRHKLQDEIERRVQEITLQIPF
ncbi:unnamed protein product [Peniophora sp. CBMAI 1063]|nr:unnamed protein product [Peniophora sp. CBMAI 1063]